MNSLHPEIDIPALDRELTAPLQRKLDNKAKPVGSLGRLESLALHVGLIQNSLAPVLTRPVLLTVAADHGVTAEGVSPCPVDITWQQVLNFLNGGGGIGLLARIYGMDLWVADAGVNHRFAPHPRLIDAKVAFGSENLRRRPAMSIENCAQAFANGRAIVRRFFAEGSNVIGFGEMGIGNSTPASALMSIICGLPVDECVGPGAGLNSAGVQHKARVIRAAIAAHGVSPHVFENLARFGGYEIATIAGGMLEAAACRMVILVDGFITTSALLVAQAINPRVLDYCIFSHQSDEPGHRKMLQFMNASAVLKLDLRLGEGTGSAIVYSVLKGAVAVLSEMTTFEEAQVTNTSHIRADHWQPPASEVMVLQSA